MFIAKSSDSFRPQPRAFLLAVSACQRKGNVARALHLVLESFNGRDNQIGLNGWYETPCLPPAAKRDEKGRLLTRCRHCRFQHIRKGEGARAGPRPGAHHRARDRGSVPSPRPLTDRARFRSTQPPRRQGPDLPNNPMRQGPDLHQGPDLQGSHRNQYSRFYLHGCVGRNLPRVVVTQTSPISHAGALDHLGDTDNSV